MSLSSSMWASVSGLMAHGNKMNVVGNNIANVSTLAYKGQRADFSDYLYTDGGSVSGTTQIGQGVSTYAVLGDYSQGSLESTNSGSDLAISGNGYFKVRKPDSEQAYYTRAGDFYFNNKRELQNPQGLILQGWKVDNDSSSVVFNSGSTTTSSSASTTAYRGTGSPKDIVLDNWNLPPKQTQSVSFTMQLSNDVGMDKTTSTTSPMTALFDQWDGSKATPLADTAYAASSPITVYDEGGTKHQLTVYYDKVDTSNSSYKINNLPSGYTMYEYIVTIPPSEDNRTYGGTGVTYDSSGNPILPADSKTFQGTQKAGMLMTGQLIFNVSGQLVNQTAYTYGAQYTSTPTVPPSDNQCPLDPALSTSWQPTKISNNGLPVFNANFSGSALSNSVSEVSTYGGSAHSLAEKSIIEMDLGLRDTNATPWNNSTNTLDDLKVVGASPSTIDYNTAPCTMSTTSRKNGASIVTSGSYIVQSSKADGYASGVLSNFNIDANGILYGKYDNNETLALYQISLYDFDNLQGLYREGNNLYSETKESGFARQGVAGDNGFGTTKAYNIEQSNVDMSREFVQMIATQRGFQANSKTITTVDSMLETVIGMKR